MLIPNQAIEALRNAQRLAVFTGAGVSAESGIPTFREKQTGIWEKFDVHDLATPQAFARNPAIVWGWYEWRRAMIRDACPNEGHAAIAAMSGLVPHLTLITQNVDDLHERAGSTAVLHLHGEIALPFCEVCHQPFAVDSLSADRASGGPYLEPPRCTTCGAKIRPGVVWFGESLPEAAWIAACEAAKSCDVFLCCGTSALVQPAASLVNMAIDAGAFTIQVNLDATHLDAKVDTTLCGPTGSLLPQLMAASFPSSSRIRSAVSRPLA